MKLEKLRLISHAVNVMVMLALWCVGAACGAYYHAIRADAAGTAVTVAPTPMPALKPVADLENPQSEWFHPMTIRLNGIETIGFVVAVPGNPPQFVVQNQLWTAKAKVPAKPKGYPKSPELKQLDDDTKREAAESKKSNG